MAFAVKCTAQLGQQVDQVKAALIGQPVAGIFLASAVEMIAASEICAGTALGGPADGTNCKNEYGFQVAVGTISTFICLVLLILPRFGVCLRMCLMS